MAQEKHIDSPNVTKEGTQAAAVESAGVEGLINRLRDQGIEQGRSQAEALITAAQQQAAEIIAEAKQEAETIVAKGKEESKKLKMAGEAAIRLAMRDTVLAMEGDLLNEFINRLRRMVKGVLADPAFLERIILEVVGKAAPALADKRAELLLPSEFISLEDLRKKPEEARPGTLMQFVLSLGGGMLREGMRFGVSDEGTAGIKVRLVDEDVQVELTENAVTGLLLRHMLPRFRALLRGAVAADTGKESEKVPG